MLARSQKKFYTFPTSCISAYTPEQARQNILQAILSHQNGQVIASDLRLPTPRQKGPFRGHCGMPLLQTSLLLTCPYAWSRWRKLCARESQNQHAHPPTSSRPAGCSVNMHWPSIYVNSCRRQPSLVPTTTMPSQTMTWNGWRHCYLPVWQALLAY